MTSAGHDGTVRLWETLTGKERLVLWAMGAGSAATRRAGRPRHRLSGARLRTVRVRRADRQGAERFEKHKGMVWSVARSPDGSRASRFGGDDNLIRLYAGRAAVKVAPELSPKELDVLWTDLGNVDAVKAYVAIGRLAESPAKACCS
ncbi:MAG: hypothetical protein U0793_30875 [Gemmataceae bacterium]